jgi:hypothetical protein
MGTRGALGVFIDGKTKATYNHFDSYPDGLGADVVAAVRNILGDPERGMDWLKTKARAIQMWPQDQRATPELIEKLKKYADTSVSTRDVAEVYVLSRKMQGDIEDYIEAEFMEEGGEAFMGDSLFCEYAYIINLDDGVLEFYRGFQKEPHEKGRYASLPFEKERRAAQYYPVALVGTLPLNELPDDWESRIFPREDDEEEAA